MIPGADGLQRHLMTDYCATRYYIRVWQVSHKWKDYSHVVLLNSEDYLRNSSYSAVPACLHRNGKWRGYRLSGIHASDISFY